MTSSVIGAVRVNGLADDDGSGDRVPNVPWNMESGRTGLRRAGGYLDEEFLPALRGKKAVQVYREMGDNDPIAGSLLFSLQRLIAEVKWVVEPASSSAEHRADATFLEECIGDMSQSFPDFIMEALSCLQYGWSWHEICFKRRMGPWYSNAANHDLHRSKYDDGRIGLAALPIRGQESLLRWAFAPDSDALLAMVQMPAPTYQMRTVPYAKSLLFRPAAPKGNPEGFSVLRRAYRPWYMKKRIEEYEAIGVERDLAGMPMASLPPEILGARPNTTEYTKLQSFMKMVKNVRRDEQDGILFPLSYDSAGNKEYEFQLLSSGGSRQFDTNGIIERYAQWMLMQVLADFILVGHQDGGSYNLHTDKTGLFKTACNGVARALAEELNRRLVPKLFSVNGMKPHELPKLVPGNVDSPDLAQLGSFMTSMAGLGIQWFPDPKMENFVRNAADLPEMDKAAERVAEQQQKQARIIASAQQRLQAIQIGQQAATGEQEVAAGAQRTQQGAIQTASAAAEFAKPGSTQSKPPPGAAVSPATTAPGRTAGASNAPSKGAKK
jgi:hypothetical protein